MALFENARVKSLHESIVPGNDPVITLGSSHFMSSGIITWYPCFFLFLLSDDWYAWYIS